MGDTFLSKLNEIPLLQPTVIMKKDQLSAEEISTLSHVVNHEIGNKVMSLLSVSSLVKQSLRMALKANKDWPPETVSLLNELMEFAGNLEGDCWKVDRSFKRLHWFLSEREGRSSSDVIDVLMKAIKEIEKTHHQYYPEILLKGVAPDIQALVPAPELQTIFIELLANALENGLPDEPVKISVEVDEESVAISFQNAVSSLEEQPLDKLCELFAMGKEKSAPNAGIGLAVTSHLVQKAGGSIELSSNRESTLEFEATISIPKKQAGSN